MSLKDIQIQDSYISYGEQNIANSLIAPALCESISYKRSVGFFSSSVFDTIFNGMMTFARNKGYIQLICSPNLSEADIQAIDLGYSKRLDTIFEISEQQFTSEIENLDNLHLQFLEELIQKKILDIKIAVTPSGIYHDKLGIFEDNHHNKVVFFGSANSSKAGYNENYEKIRVEKSWNLNESFRINDEEREFLSLWENTNEHVTTYDFKKCVQNSIIKVREQRKKLSDENDSKKIVLRDYQEAAIQAWINNNYHGFFVMATGTGKTWTAIFALKELLKMTDALIIICAPYKHLLKQWCSDLEKIFLNGRFIIVSSENPEWSTQIDEEIIRTQYNKANQVIIISTIKSFKTNRFRNSIAKYNGKKVLVVDEAHRFTNRPNSLNEDYDYLLGLSATPYSGNSLERGNDLMNFFGGKVFDLPIEEALNRSFLVPYSYHPIFVNATKSEEKSFQRISSQMAGCFKNGICTDIDKLSKLKRARLRIIAMAEEKHTKIERILKNVPINDHFIVYCGDGRIQDNKFGSNDNLRDIQYIKKTLNNLGFKPSQFTASENMNQRMELIDSFNKGLIDTLVAIRCLDEGIDIPSIKAALILASNDDYREFVQRRGRILRLYNDKTHADIYDIIVLPSSDLTNFAKIELRRFYEYARLARNKDELFDTIRSLLIEYTIHEDELRFMNEHEEETDFDDE